MPASIDVGKVQEYLKWMEEKFSLNIISDRAKKRYVKRGQVYRCKLGIGIGSEMQKERPCVIIQNDIGNYKSGNTIVAPITHDDAKFPFLVPVTIQKDENGSVILDGQVNVSNITCVSKARLGDYVTKLSNPDMKDIEIAIAKSLDLIVHYSKLKISLDDKLIFIEKIKRDRNEAQDFIKKLREITNTATNEQLEKIIMKN
ncbi:MAG: type II toxin-antitoxin system PemK/MazF family toxin [Bacillota bacterium]|nr:type II toxin-antitoxin system PemK/MazF family toxin [Bacillota bacterium]